MNKNNFLSTMFFFTMSGLVFSGYVFADCDIPADSMVAGTACDDTCSDPLYTTELDCESNMETWTQLNGSRGCDLLRAQERYCKTLELDDLNSPTFYTDGPEIREQHAFCVQNSGEGESACYQLDQDIPETSLVLMGAANTVVNAPPIGIDQHDNVWSLSEGGTLGCLAADAGVSYGSSTRETHCGFLYNDAPDQVVLFPPTLVTNLDQYSTTSSKQNRAFVETEEDKTRVWFSQWSESAYLWTHTDRTVVTIENTLIDNEAIAYGGVALPTKDVWCSRHQSQWAEEVGDGAVDGACGLMEAEGGGWREYPAFTPYGLSKIFALEVDHEFNEDPVWKIYYPAGLPYQEGLSEHHPRTTLEGKKGDGLTNVHNVRRDSVGRTWFITFSSEHLAQIGYFDPDDFSDGDPISMDPATGDCQHLERAGAKNDLCLDYYEPSCDGNPTAYENCFHFFDLPNLAFVTDFVIDDEGDIWFLASLDATIGLLDLSYAEDNLANEPTLSQVKLYPLDRGFFNALIAEGYFEILGQENMGDFQITEWMELVTVDEQQYLSIQAAGLHGRAGLFSITMAKAGNSCDVSAHTASVTDLFEDNPCSRVLFTQRSETALTLPLKLTANGDGFLGATGVNPFTGSIVSSVVVIPKDTIVDDLGGDGEGVVNYSNWLVDDANRKAHEYLLGTSITAAESFQFYQGNSSTGDLWGSGGYNFVKYKKIATDELILDAYADTGVASINNIPVSRMALKSKGNCLGAGSPCYVLLAEDEESFGVRILMDTDSALIVTATLEECDPDCSTLNRTSVGSAWGVDVDDPYSLCNILEPGTCDSVSPTTAFRPTGNGLYLYTLTNNRNANTVYLVVKVSDTPGDLDSDTINDEDEFVAEGFPSDFTMADSDEDGTDDDEDEFPRDVRETVDTDNDALGNEADEDDDNDNVQDVNDAYPLISLDGRTDTDGDGAPDTCDMECEGEGMFADNCTDIANRFQQDTDQDGYGNACDGDVNDPNDGVVDILDLRLLISDGQADWVNVAMDPFPIAKVPHFKEESGISQETFYEWSKEDPHEPGPSGLDCAGISIPCPEEP